MNARRNLCGPGALAAYLPIPNRAWLRLRPPHGAPNTDRGDRTSPLTETTNHSEFEDLDLAPEADSHPSETGLVGPVTWPELNVPRGVITRTSKSCKIAFSYGIFSSATQMTPTAAEDLADISNQLRDRSDDFTLLVEGHTDATPISSQGAMYVDNFALGMARAEKVKDYLKNECQLAGGFMRTASAGAADPPHPNDTDESRRKNRTVVLTLTPR